MMKSVILITFSVLTVVKFVIAKHLLEADTKENIEQNSKQRSVEGSIEQSAGEIKPENSTAFNLNNIQVEEVNIATDRLPNIVKIEKLGDDSSSKYENEKTEGNEEQEQQHDNVRVGVEDIAVTDIESSTQPAEEGDKHVISDTVDENSKEYAEESLEIGAHRHINVPDDEEVQHIFFALEPIGMESVHRSEASSISNEDKVGASRHGRPEILLGGRRVLHPELLKKKLQAAQALDVLSKIGSSRSFSSDLVPSHTKLFNAPMHHPQSHDPSGIHHSPSSHDNSGLNYKDNVLRNPNSEERIGREYTLDADANSYPYTPPTSNNRSDDRDRVESRSINSAAHTLPSHQVSAFHNLFDYNYSPVINPIFGAGRLKRNTSTATVETFLEVPGTN